VRAGNGTAGGCGGAVRMGKIGQADVASMQQAKPAELDKFFWRAGPGPAADFTLMGR
jgi:hypothetical protein